MAVTVTLGAWPGLGQSWARAGGAHSAPRPGIKGPLNREPQNQERGPYEPRASYASLRNRPGPRRFPVPDQYARSTQKSTISTNSRLIPESGKTSSAARAIAP